MWIAFVELMDYLIANANHKFADPFISNAKQQTKSNFRKLQFVEVFVEVPITGVRTWSQESFRTLSHSGL